MPERFKSGLYTMQGAIQVLGFYFCRPMYIGVALRARARHSRSRVLFRGPFNLLEGHSRSPILVPISRCENCGDVHWRITVPRVLEVSVRKQETHQEMR